MRDRGRRFGAARERWRIRVRKYAADNEGRGIILKLLMGNIARATRILPRHVAVNIPRVRAARQRKNALLRALYITSPLKTHLRRRAFLVVVIVVALSLIPRNF